MDWVVPILQQHGLAGAVIAFLTYALIKVDNRRNDEIDARLKDALAWQKTVMDNTSAIGAIAEKLEKANLVIEALAQANRVTSETIRDLRRPGTKD